MIYLNDYLKGLAWFWICCWVTELGLWRACCSMFCTFCSLVSCSCSCCWVLAFTCRHHSHRYNYLCNSLLLGKNGCRR